MGEKHVSMGVHVPMWCATCSHDDVWVDWPCEFADPSPPVPWSESVGMNMPWWAPLVLMFIAAAVIAVALLVGVTRG